MNLLNIMSVKSVHWLQALKFAFQWYKKELVSSFQNYFQYADQVHNNIIMHRQCVLKRIFINDTQEQILKNSQSNLYMLTSGKIFPIISCSPLLAFVPPCSPLLPLLPFVTPCNKGEQGVTRGNRGNKGEQGVTRGNKEGKGVTRGNKG